MKIYIDEIYGELCDDASAEQNERAKRARTALLLKRLYAKNSLPLLVDLVENINDKKETIMIGNDPVSDIQGAKDAGISCLFIPDALGSKYKMQNQKGKDLADYSIMDRDFTKIINLTVT